MHFLAQVQVLTESKHGFVILRNEKTGSFEIAAFSKSLEVDSRFAGNRSQLSLEPSDPTFFGGFCGQALQTGAPFFTNSPAPPLPSPPSMGGRQWTNFLAVPLLLEEKPYAIVAVADHSSGFSDYHTKVASRLGELFVIASQFRRLHIERQESLASLHNLIDNIPGVVFRRESESPWRFEFVSSQAQSLLGQSARHLQARNLPFLPIVFPEDVPVLGLTIQRAVLSRKPYSCEYRILHSEGETRWVAEFGNPIILIGSEEMVIEGVLLDITDRKKVEKEWYLQSLVLDQIQDMVTVTDLKGIIRYVNQAQTQASGQPREHLIGRHVHIFFGEDPNLGTTQAEIIRRTNLDGKWRGQIVNTRTDGSKVFLDCRTQRVFNPSGQPVALCGISTDVTRQQEMERALIKSEERFQQLFRSMINGVALHEIILGPHGRPVDYRFLKINPAFTQITGLGPEIIGRTVREIMPRTEAFFIRTYGKTALSGEPCSFESYSRELGKFFEVSAFSPSPRQFATVIADITTRRLVANALEESERNFRTLVESLDDIILRFDSRRCFQYVSPRFSRLVKTNLASLLGKPPKETALPEEFRDFLNHSLRKGRRIPTIAEQEFHSSSGFCILEWRFFSQRNAQRRLQSILAIGRDITVQKIPENEKEVMIRLSQWFRSARPYAEIQKMIPALLAKAFYFPFCGWQKWHPDTDEIEFLAISGFELPSLPFRVPASQTIAGAVARHKKAKVVFARNEHREKSHEAFAPVHARTFLCAPILVRGETDTVLTLASPFRCRQAQGLISSLGNITDFLSHELERRLAQRELRESEARFRTLAHAAHEGIVFTCEGIIIEANPQFCRMVGHQDLIGRNILDFIAKPWRQETARRIAEQNEEPYESQILTRRGPPRWIKVAVKEMLFQGRVVRMAAIHDIHAERMSKLALETANHQLQSLAAQIQDVREDELLRISRRLHDDLAQSLTAVKIGLDRLESHLRSQNKDGKTTTGELIPDIRESIEGAIDTVRTLSRELRPGILDDLGLLPAIEWLLTNFHRRTNIAIRLHSTLKKIRISRDQSLAVFRILQEALTNVARHAQADSVEVKVFRQQGRTCITVTDNGIGIPTISLNSSRSIGIIDMIERARQFGGTLKLSRASKRGTVIRLVFSESSP
jgi:two-component system sensor histidine kinase UhpB